MLEIGILYRTYLLQARISTRSRRSSCAIGIGRRHTSRRMLVLQVRYHVRRVRTFNVKWQKLRKFPTPEVMSELRNKNYLDVLQNLVR